MRKLVAAKEARKPKYPLMHVDGHLKSVQGMCADEIEHGLIWNELQKVLAELRNSKAYRAELAAYTPEFLKRVERGERKD